MLLSGRDKEKKDKPKSKCSLCIYGIVPARCYPCSKCKELWSSSLISFFALI